MTFNLSQTFRATLLLPLFGAAVSPPAWAQAAGRWVLHLDNPASAIRGELRLAVRDGRLEGRVLEDAADSAWIQLTGGIARDRYVAFDADLFGGLHFEGVVSGDVITGDARGPAGGYAWRSNRLKHDREFYAALPRFTQRQLRIGSAENEITLPGPWLAAAMESGPDEIYRVYAAIARSSGMEPLSRASLPRTGLLRAMGVYQRAEMKAAVSRVLAGIREGIRDDTTRARFDLIFRPDGRWQVDVHDVALARVQRKFPGISWGTAEPALRAAGHLPDDSAAGVASVPLALYRLWAGQRCDSMDVWPRDAGGSANAASTRAVDVLLDGYDDAAAWYIQAMEFFLNEPWLPEGSDGRSLAGLVARHWPRPVTSPMLAVHAWGYPEGSARIGADTGLVAQLVRPENEDARRWLDRHGPAELLATLHRLPLDYGPATIMERSGGPVRLSSVGEYAAEAFNGFLEPLDRIDLDPSYVPLLAVATVLHEWHHILAEQARRQLPPDERSVRDLGFEVAFIPPDPYLAEGLAEWKAERILAPVADRWPLFSFGEAEKRASLNRDDPHVLGYLMVRALSDALEDDGTLDSLVVAHGADAAAIASLPALRNAWAEYRDQPDQTVPYRGGVTVVPETEFRVEDGQPMVVGSRVRER
ncbi:MAG: hypothetical protein ACREL6_06255 [Gemmatimonadales bacterium]